MSRTRTTLQLWDVLFCVRYTLTDHRSVRGHKSQQTTANENKTAMEHLQTTETCHRIFVPYNIQLQNLPMYGVEEY